MTENDYIAEYIKERYPQLLGLDYALWRASKVAREYVQRLASIFENVDLSKIVTTKETEETKTESEVKEEEVEEESEVEE